MPLSKFKQAVLDASEYYAPTLGISSQELAHALFTIAALEGGLGEEAGVGDGGASVGRFQFNTAGGHGSTLIKGGKTRQEISDDEFQAWHWAPILGGALASELKSGKSLEEAIIEAGFKVERPAKMYDPGRAQAALQTAATHSGMSSSTSTYKGGFGRGAPITRDAPTPEGGPPPSSPAPSGSLADLMQFAAESGMFGYQKTLGSNGKPAPRSVPGGSISDILSGMKNLGVASKSDEFSKFSSLQAFNKKRDSLMQQMMDLQSAGQPIPAALKKQLTEMQTVQGYFDGTADLTGESESDTQLKLMQALASVYGTAVSAGNMSSDAAYRKLDAQMKQAPFLTPREYMAGAESNSGPFATMMPGFNKEHYRTQKVEMGDPNEITDSASRSMKDVLEAILGGGGMGGSADMSGAVPTPEPSSAFGSVLPGQQTSPADFPGGAGGVSSAVLGFLNGDDSAGGGGSWGGGANPDIPSEGNNFMGLGGVPGNLDWKNLLASAFMGGAPLMPPGLGTARMGADIWRMFK